MRPFDKYRVDICDDGVIEQFKTTIVTKQPHTHDGENVQLSDIVGGDGTAEAAAVFTPSYDDTFSSTQSIWRMSNVVDSSGTRTAQNQTSSFFTIAPQYSSGATKIMYSTCLRLQSKAIQIAHNTEADRKRVFRFRVCLL